MSNRVIMNHFKNLWNRSTKAGGNVAAAPTQPASTAAPTQPASTGAAVVPGSGLVVSRDGTYPSLPGSGSGNGGSGDGGGGGGAPSDGVHELTKGMAQVRSYSFAFLFCTILSS